MTKLTDPERVRRYLLEHPGSTTNEIRFGLFISNVTARLSDIRREHGPDYIVKWRDDAGHFRYRLNERPVDRGTQVDLGLAS